MVLPSLTAFHSTSYGTESSPDDLATLHPLPRSASTEQMCPHGLALYALTHCVDASRWWLQVRLPGQASRQGPNH